VVWRRFDLVILAEKDCRDGGLKWQCIANCYLFSFFIIHLLIFIVRCISFARCIHRIVSCRLCALDFAVLHVGCDGRVSRCTWNYYGFSICRGAQVIKLHVRSFSPALLSTVLFDRRLYGSSDILPGQMRGWTIQEHCAQLFQGYRVTESLEASSRPTQTAMDVNR